MYIWKNTFSVCLKEMSLPSDDGLKTSSGSALAVSSAVTSVLGELGLISSADIDFSPLSVETKLSWEGAALAEDFFDGLISFS